jgi:hypothetical protein
MSTTQKDWLSRWLPLVVAIAANVITIAYSYGKLEQRLVPIETHTGTFTHERFTKNFITREQFDLQKASRDREVDEVRSALREINHKLDRLIERGK